MGDSEVPYRRVLLKLSGEALMGALDYGIEPGTIKRIADEIATATNRGGTEPRSHPYTRLLVVVMPTAVRRPMILTQ